MLMDRIDKTILHMLAQNANETATRIGEAVGLSVPAVNKRIRRLQQDGVIRRFTILTDGKQVGRPICAFIWLVVQYGAGVEGLISTLERDPEVLACYAVTGEYDYMVQVCTPDVQALEEKILKLKRYKGVVKSYTMLSLQEHKFQPAVLPDLKQEDEA